MQNSVTNNHQHGAQGQVLIYAVLLIAVLASFIAVLAGTLIPASRFNRISTDAALSLELGEAGIDKAIWCLNHQTECPANYTGESQNLGAGSYAVTVTPSGNSRILTATGTTHGKQRTVEVTVTNQASTNASFYYGVQAGVGGIDLANNSRVVGNVYTSGSINGTSGSTVTGDAILALGSPTQDAGSDPSVNPLNTATIGNASATLYAAQSFLSGVNDKVYSVDLKIAKVNNPTSTVTLYFYSDNAGTPGTNISGAGQVITASVPSDSAPGWENGWVAQVFSPATQLVQGARYWLVVKVSQANATKYWRIVTSSPGDDSAYPDGTAKIDNDLASMPAACTGGCDVAFRVNVGGVAPTLHIPTVGGNGYARTIESTTIGGKAYYQNLIGTVKAAGGSDTCTDGENGPNCFDNQPDQSPQNFPITESQVTQMESQAAAGGTVTCSPTCTIPTGASIGPKKYVGDVRIDLGAVVNLTGTVWVVGDFTISNNAILQLDPAYGVSSGVVIADDPANRTTKGRITLSNNGDLRGNGTPGTYIMALSMNGDPTFTNDAIDITNNLTAGIAYAANGAVDISNNASLKEVTGQKIKLQNNASITYESGLANVIFSGGPGGAWAIQKQTWREVK
ncbi:MAG: hypothetical protein V1778_05170 [bacterium]